LEVATEQACLEKLTEFLAKASTKEEADKKLLEYQNWLEAEHAEKWSEFVRTQFKPVDTFSDFANSVIEKLPKTEEMYQASKDYQQKEDPFGRRLTLDNAEQRAFVAGVSWFLKILDGILKED
jgi:hypothetical protein